MPDRISIAMTTFNGARFLSQQLESFLAQTRHPDELVICDDGSQDETLSIAQRFADTAPFSVHLHRNTENLGITKNFEKAIGLTTGGIIFLADQDDVWLPEKLSTFMAVFDAHPGVGLVSCDARAVDASLDDLGYTMWQGSGFLRGYSHRVKPSNGFKTLLKMPQADAATLAFRSRFKPVILPLADWWGFDQWIAMTAAAVSDWHAIKRPLNLYRQHDSQRYGVSQRSVRAWAAAAPSLGADRFTNAANVFDQLAERLAAHQDMLQSPVYVRLAKEKALFNHARAAMRTRPKRRAAIILGQLLRGRYFKFGRGWLTFARDVKG